MEDRNATRCVLDTVRSSPIGELGYRDDVGRAAIRVAGLVAVLAACSTTPNEARPPDTVSTIETVTDRTAASIDGDRDVGDENADSGSLDHEDDALIVSTFGCYRIGPNAAYEALGTAGDVAHQSDAVIEALVLMEDVCAEAAELWREDDRQTSAALDDASDAARALADCSASDQSACRVEVIDFEETLSRLTRILDGNDDELSAEPATAAPPPSVPTSTSAVLSSSEVGAQLAQELATAFADGDWDTARRISPLPAWDDATYEEGFEGLEAASVFLGGTEEPSPDIVTMYLLQVAHEQRPGGPQTSLYCVRWDLEISTQTIDRVAGELILREDGFTPPSDARRGAIACDWFDVIDQTPGNEPELGDDEGVPDLPATGFDPWSCTFNDVALWGNVYFAKGPEAADVLVSIDEVGLTADLNVAYTNFLGLADSCGRWFEVSNVAAADFTVYVTDAFASGISIHEVTFEYLAGVGQ